jgi:hypothetical protein
VNDRDDQRLRDLILDRLGEEERDALEARLLADDDLGERAAALEDELAEGYAAGALPAPERAAFEQRLARVPRLRERVDGARAFDALAARRPAASTASWLRRTWDALRPPPAALPWSLATGLLVAVGAGLVGRGLVDTHRRETEALRAERDAARAAAERGASEAHPSSPATFVLSPGTARDDRGIAVLRWPSPSGRVVLLLDLDDAPPGSAYRSQILDAGGAQVSAADGLRARPAEEGAVLEVAVVPDTLPPGRYELRLEVRDRGRLRPAGTYVFRVAAP